MLGFLYKVAHRLTYPSFNNLFPFTAHQAGQFVDGHVRHDKQLSNRAHTIEFRENLWRRSVFGLVTVFNRLPQHVVDQEDVSSFQTCLTEQVRAHCALGTTDWHAIFDAERSIIRESR